MKAAIYTQYGPPEVIELVEREIPRTFEKDVLIKVMASTVNRTDAGFRSAEYFVSRFWTGLFKPKYQILGCEYAGEIVATGAKVKNYKVGDRVVGFDDKKMGGHAEYLVVNENSTMGIMPSNFSYIEAAPLLEGAHYALINIRASKVSGGQHALVYGATGAIGSAAVQLLKFFGIKVTAVCNTKNVELVKSLGADVVIDYQTEDFTKTSQSFEFIFDAVGKSSFRQCKPLLSEKGIYISTELGKNGANVFYALFAPFLGSKKVLFPIPSIYQADIDFLLRLAENGLFKPVLDRKFKLDDIVDAYNYVESGQKVGNVVLEIR
ncbi:MAG: NAD(P)-dependent alcohol dehydrogenase [Bacteroidia bacterium]|nr:NAD(P)-dependent alcohol dehydrogenase [Bacteroidia bacterium]MCF8447971.1 NAD(P)-dependent alcohol dehydrogenase [Bacteroidia bacterium]